MSIEKIKKELDQITPWPWVWGYWTIFSEDREAQRKGEPYWTLIDCAYCANLISGPVGRKEKDVKYILSGDGYESDGIIWHNDYDADFIVKAPERIAALIKIIELQMEALEDISLNTKSKRKASIETRIKIIGINAELSLRKTKEIIESMK